jgi:RNA polymerase sigma-70 factor (ECF subfamily)
LNAPGAGQSGNGLAWARERAEAELVERLKTYDEAAVRQVYRLYSDGIYRYALYQSGNPELAEDVVGEVFVRMMDSIASYEYRGSPISAWLYRIARNLVIDQQRRGNRLQALDEAHDSRLISENPVDLAERELGWAELRGALRELTDEQRQVIILKFIESLENREVAAIIGKSEGSVKSLQHRALRSLRRVLEKRGSHAGRA